MEYNSGKSNKSLHTRESSKKKKEKKKSLASPFQLFLQVSDEETPINSLVEVPYKIIKDELQLQHYAGPPDKF